MASDPVETSSPLPVARIPGARRRRVFTEVARIFSTVCNPFLTSMTLFVILAHTYAPDAGRFWQLLLTSVAFTSVGPMLFIFWLYLRGKISDLDMSVREERTKVFAVFVVFFALGTLALWLIKAPAIMTASMAGYAASSIVVELITRRWKISTHALGITAPLIALCVLFGWEAAPFLVLVPIVGWSRIYLKAHTPLQVYAGTGLAIISTLIFFRLFRVV